MTLRILNKRPSTGQTETLKPISTPDPAYPDEAVKEGIEGKVTLRIVVDEQGRVSQATAVSGPPALVSAAVSAVKMWRFEPPRHAPSITTAELSFGLPRECPGLASDSGQVGTTGRLVDRDGKLVAVDDDDFNNDLPAYPEKDRKAGISGELVLLITLSATAQLQNVQVFKSLLAEPRSSCIRCSAKLEIQAPRPKGSIGEFATGLSVCPHVHATFLEVFPFRCSLLN